MSQEHRISFRPVAYDSPVASSSSLSSSIYREQQQEDEQEPHRIDSGVTNSPAEPPNNSGFKHAYVHPQGHRIIPPSIKGHGRLIVAHRTVPYWGGAMIVAGSFIWAVLCAVYISAFLA